ncbi:MAG: hypothetical protein K8R23_15935 [Chthoniobacter sp.]|nr:hypothetical protein [Chthoniobacter sp.]
MRAIALLFLVSLAGCASNVHHRAMTGLFRSQSEAVMITPDRCVYLSHRRAHAEEMGWLGMILVDPKTPREALLRTASASRWVGRTFLFETDYKGFAVYPYGWQLGDRPKAEKRFERVY